MLFPHDCIHRIIPVAAVKRIRRIDVLLSLGFAFLLTGVTFWLIPLRSENPVDIYVQIAKNLYRFTEFPYGARILTPVLVGILPLDINTGFRFVAFFSYVLWGTFLTIWLRLTGISLGWALGLLPVLYFASTAKFIVANAWYIDPMSYWILVVSFLGVMTGNFGLTMASLALGALNRPESLTILVVLAVAWQRKDRAIRSFLSIGLCALPALLLYLAMRYLWPLISDFQVWQELGGEGIYNDPQPYAEIFAQQGFKALIDPNIYKETLPCLWGLSIVGLTQSNWRIRWIMLAQIILAILPMMIATDYFRLPFYVFPALFFLSAVGIQTLSRIHPGIAGAALSAVLLLTAFAPQSILGGTILAGFVCAVYWGLKNPGDGSQSTFATDP